MAKIPGTPGVPPGGILLNTPQPPQMTQHKTMFHGCVIGLFVVLGEDNVCQGYKLLIQDPRNNHSYEADFGQDIIDEWKKDLSNFPRVGQKPEGVDGKVV